MNSMADAGESERRLGWRRGHRSTPDFHQHIDIIDNTKFSKIRLAGGRGRVTQIPSGKRSLLSLRAVLSGRDIRLRRADGVPAVLARGPSAPPRPPIRKKSPKMKRRQGRSCDRPLSGRDKGLPDASRGPSKPACTPRIRHHRQPRSRGTAGRLMAAKNPGLPSGGLLRTSGQALVRPIPSASSRRGLRRPRAAIRNPNPRRPTLACRCDPRPDPGLARASLDGAFAPACACLAAGPPIAGSWTPEVRPAVIAVPADPLRDPRDPDRRPGSPHRADPSTPSLPAAPARPQGNEPTVRKGKELPPRARLAPCFRRPLRRNAPTPSFPRRHPFGAGSCQWIAS